MIIDHIGIVVKDIQEGIAYWQVTFGYEQATEVVENSRQKVLVVFMKKNASTMVKLIQAVDETSLIFAFARRGGGLHHLCFKVENMETGATHLQENGCRLIVPAQPGEAYGNHDIAFLLSKTHLNIELIDTDYKAERI